MQGKGGSRRGATRRTAGGRRKAGGRGGVPTRLVGPATGIEAGEEVMMGGVLRAGEGRDVGGAGGTMAQAGVASIRTTPVVVVADPGAGGVEGGRGGTTAPAAERRWWRV